MREEEVASFRYLHEAELARGFLEDAGVPAAAVGDPAGQIQYGKGFSSRARVLVRDSDVARARTVLEEAGMVDEGAEPASESISRSIQPEDAVSQNQDSPTPMPNVSPYRSDLLAGQVALVTGGGTGIGRGISLALAAHGADVALVSRNREHLEPTAEEVREVGRRAVVATADVRDRDTLDEAVRRTTTELGRLDILVNNAAGNFLCPAEELSRNGWRAVVEIVLDGTFHASQAVFEHMRDAGGGAILNITTTYVRTGAAYMSHSGAAKAGVLNLTRSLAAEWGRHGIRVNAIAPGLVEETEGARRLVESVGRMEEFTETVPLGRLTQVEDVARGAVFLVSTAGAHVTGAELVVDGGESVGGKFNLL